MGPHGGACGLPSRPGCALSMHPNCLCVSGLSLPGLRFLLGSGLGTGAEDVSPNTKPFSTRMPFTATRLAATELGCGRRSSAVLNWFSVSQVAREFGILQVTKHELAWHQHPKLALGMTPSPTLGLSFSSTQWRIWSWSALRAILPAH